MPPDVIRLPYHTTVIEYYHKEAPLKGISELALKDNVDDRILQLFSKGHGFRDKVVVIATQFEDGPIDFSVISHTPETNSWTTSPFTATLPSDKGSLVTALNEGRLPIEVTNRSELSDAWFTALAASITTGPLTAILELVEALSFSNVNVVELPAKKMTFTEKRKGALPYDSYRMLVINKGEKVISAGRSETGPCGERRAAREHTRRGHDRTYKSGKKIWINPMVINAGVGGKIVKDYKLK
ncbi:hypothetical protein D3C73_816270 [compost metagenome]